MQLVTQFKQTLTIQPETGFKRRLTGWIVTILNALFTLNSTFVFLFFLKVGFVGWLMLNSCAPSNILFIAGFLLGSPAVMVAAAVLMFRYGTLGLFVFSWAGTNLIAQAGHIAMTLAVIYIFTYVVHHKQWRSLLCGLLLGIAILIPFMIVQTQWLDARPELVEMLFSGNWD